MQPEASTPVPSMSSLLARRTMGLTGSVIRQMLELPARPDLISFAGGLPPTEAFDTEGIGAAVNAALEREPASCLQYGPTSGATPLRNALCEIMRSRGVVVNPDELIVTTGAQQAIALVGEALLEPGNVVALERPTYPASIQMANLREARIVTAPSDSDGMDVEELEDRIRRDRPKLLYLVPTFGNPSGAVLSLDRRLRLLDMAVRYGFLILEDDPYGELYFDTAPFPPLIALARRVPSAMHHCAYCSSLSKIVSPGFRVGWLIAPPELLHAATIIKQGQDAHTSALAQYAAFAYLQSGRLESNLTRLRDLYRSRANMMTAAIKAKIDGVLEHATPRGGMFLWARLRTNVDSTQLFHAAMQNGVAFVPGTSFMAEGRDPNALRLSFAGSDLPKIREGISRLATTLEGFPKC
jgi:2-aminoadipate transaminase